MPPKEKEPSLAAQVRGDRAAHQRVRLFSRHHFFCAAIAHELPSPLSLSAAADGDRIAEKP